MYSISSSSVEGLTPMNGISTRLLRDEKFACTASTGPPIFATWRMPLPPFLNGPSIAVTVCSTGLVTEKVWAPRPQPKSLTDQPPIDSGMWRRSSRFRVPRGWLRKTFS